MPTRKSLIERIMRQIYGGLWTDDAEITYNLVNAWLGDAVAIAAKQNYNEAFNLEGVGYVNNSFYSTFSNLAITSGDEPFEYYVELPQVPIGIGRNEGIATLQFKKDGEISQTAIPLSINQVGYDNDMRVIPNKILYWNEGNKAVVKSTVPLFEYTAKVRMVSAGDGTDLNSTINVPEDYFPVMVDYISKMLMVERNAPKDIANDALDKP